MWIRPEAPQVMHTKSCGKAGASPRTGSRWFLKLQNFSPVWASDELQALQEAQLRPSPGLPALESHLGPVSKLIQLQSVSVAVTSLVCCIPAVDEGLVVQESLHSAAVVLLRHVAAAKGGGKLVIFSMTSACIGCRFAGSGVCQTSTHSRWCWASILFAGPPPAQ